MSCLSSCDFVPAPSGSAVALGFFDGVHRGHQLILQRALEIAACEGLTPAVYSFRNHPLSVLRPDIKVELLMSLAERCQRLAGLGLTCVVEEFTRETAELDPQEFLERVLLRQLKARAVVCGANYSFGHQALGTPAMLAAWGEKAGVKVEVVELASYRQESISSTRLRRLVRTGRLEEVADMLGEPFSLSGEVGRGRQLGRRWGFPTANLQWPEEKVAPALGAYACQVVMPDGEVLPGVGYFGSRPTVNDDHSLVCLETNIGFWHAGRACWNERTFTEDGHGDYHLYGQRITVRLLSFLAPQERFENLEQLRERLAIYREKTAEVLAQLRHNRG